jgi:8-oxo-dGTP diphosphatase
MQMPIELPVCSLAGAILLQDGAVLLGKRASARAFYPGVWDVFGGHIEEHESPEDGLARELEEEIGLIPLAFTEVAVVEFEVAAADGARARPSKRYEYHLFHVTRWTGTPRNRLVEEHSEIRWAPLDEVESLQLASPEYLPIFRTLAATDSGRS